MPVVIVAGPRQAGKSTAASLKAAEHDAHYLTLSDAGPSETANDDPTRDRRERKPSPAASMNTKEEDRVRAVALVVESIGDVPLSDPSADEPPAVDGITTMRTLGGSVYA